MAVASCSGGEALVQGQPGDLAVGEQQVEIPAAELLLAQQQAGAGIDPQAQAALPVLVAPIDHQRLATEQRLGRTARKKPGWMAAMEVEGKTIWRRSSFSSRAAGVAAASFV